MAWTVPMTAVAGSPFASADYNTFVRDNQLQCPTALATTAGSYAVSTGPNAMVERIPAMSSLIALETTTSTSFTNLATNGPAVTVTTGTSALIVITAECHNGTASEAARVGVNITGATTEAPNSLYILRQETNGTAEFQQCSTARLHTSLSPGSNTFTMQYAVTAGTGSFNFRSIIVMPY